MLHKESGLFSE